MLFQSYVQRTFSIDELIVLLEENTARNREFDYDRFELADMDTSERTESFSFFFKHDLPELSWPLHLPEGGKRGDRDPVSRTNFNKIHASRFELVIREI